MKKNPIPSQNKNKTMFVIKIKNLLKQIHWKLFFANSSEENKSSNFEMFSFKSNNYQPP